MAHYNITHTCGHEERIELFGKVSGRESRIEWLETQMCRACKAAQDSEGLPKLSGTEKQTAWAARIRRTFIDQTESQLGHVILTNPLAAEAANELLNLVKDSINEQTSAAWWINNRNRLEPEFAKMAMAKREASKQAD